MAQTLFHVCVCKYTVVACADPTKHRGKSTLLTGVMQHAHVYISTCMYSMLSTCWLKLAVAKNSILVRLKYICGRWWLPPKAPVVLNPFH